MPRGEPSNRLADHGDRESNLEAAAAAVDDEEEEEEKNEEEQEDIVGLHHRKECHPARVSENKGLVLQSCARDLQVLMGKLSGLQAAEPTPEEEQLQAIIATAQDLQNRLGQGRVTAVSSRGEPPKRLSMPPQERRPLKGGQCSKQLVPPRPPSQPQQNQIYWELKRQMNSVSCSKELKDWSTIDYLVERGVSSQGRVR